MTRIELELPFLKVDTIHKPATRARDRYKSGMMYINGTFFVDKRDKHNIDYSEPIRKWAEDPKRDVGPFNVDTMETTRLDSLTLRVGYPYVYIHQVRLFELTLKMSIFWLV